MLGGEPCSWWQLCSMSTWYVRCIWTSTLGSDTRLNYRELSRNKSVLRTVIDAFSQPPSPGTTSVKETSYECVSCNTLFGTSPLYWLESHNCVLLPSPVRGRGIVVDVHNCAIFCFALLRVGYPLAVVFTRELVNASLFGNPAPSPTPNGRSSSLTSSGTFCQSGVNSNGCQRHLQSVVYTSWLVVWLMFLFVDMEGFGQILSSQ